jgi:soluble lytic murein transglycosylase-like protein
MQTKAAQIGVDKIIHKAAQTYGLDPNVIAAVINAQSNFEPKAVSPAGAQGLMQLMPATASELGVTNAFDPEQNIMGASRYLKSLVDRYDGDITLALRAYTWGIGNVDRNPNPPPVEVELFVAKVIAASTETSIAQRSTATVLAEISQLNPLEEKRTFEFKYDSIQQKA